MCAFCFEFANAALKNEMKPKKHQRLSIESPNGNETSNESVSSHLNKAAPYQHNCEVAFTRPSPLIFGYSESLNDNSLLLSPVDSDLRDQPDVKQHEDSRIITIDSANSVETSESLIMKRNNCPQARTRKRHYSAELLKIIECGGLMENKAIAQIKGNEELPHEIKKLSVSEKIQKENAACLRTKAQSRREAALDKCMQNAHEQVRDGIKRSISNIASSLPDSEVVDLNQLALTLEDITSVVIGHLLFSMNFRSPNGFNYSNLVKIKSIAIPASYQAIKKKPMYDFKWLAGTVCHKHLSHKQMAKQVVNPRILLFACGISYDRSSGAGKMSSLDTLLEQEKSYMAILVDKISALEPDLIFVEKTVSRYARELLCERRISIVLNVKSELLYRIARHIGADVLTSVDHVDKAIPAHVTGRCRSFRVKSIPVESGIEVLPVEKLIKKASVILSRVRSDTYLYLDGCDPLNGCTVLITGPLKPSLRVLKRLTRLVLLMAYRLVLEANVLSHLSLNSRKQSNYIEEQRTTWCTTSTQRILDRGSTNPRFHQCAEPKHLCIVIGSDDDVTFGNFLNQELAALSLKCQNINCNSLMADHAHSFSCRSGTIKISFEELPDIVKLSSPNSVSQLKGAGLMDKSFGFEQDLNLRANITPDFLAQTSLRRTETPSSTENEYPQVLFWRWCRECEKVLTPIIPLEKYIYKYSFARFLEVLFTEAEGNSLPTSPSATCTHTINSHVFFFNIGNSVARFEFFHKVSLRLACIDIKCSDSAPSRAKFERAVVESEASARLASLKRQLQSLTKSFTEKVQGINGAVKAFEQTNMTHYSPQLILEVMCISKMVRNGDALFRFKLKQLEIEFAGNLGACDVTQRALYLFACKWITCLLRLRKLIKKHILIQAAPLAPKSASFTLGSSLFHRMAALSSMQSPRTAGLSPPELGATVRYYGGDEMIDPPSRCRSSVALGSLPKLEASTRNATRSSLTLANVESSKRPVIPFFSSKHGYADEIELRSTWNEALQDLNRILGRSDPEKGLTIGLPDALTAGHPSLPCRSKTQVVLVNETQPITYVAYALSTDSYEEELDGWKLRVHNDAVKSVAAQIQIFDGTSTNWSRAALETTLNTPFSFTAVEMPLHVSLLAGKTSSTASCVCWEMSMIAYYPLQFEVLRELFFGKSQSYIFSISHVAQWDASGGKSGASFFRTLDDRFIIKHISSKEMQSFLGCLPAYFCYMASVFFDGRASLLSKTFGLYQTTIVRKDTGQRMVQYICVTENAFYRKQITQRYDLKGSSRNRFVKPLANLKVQQNVVGPLANLEIQQNVVGDRVLLDGNFLEFTKGFPLGVLAEHHQYISKAVENDTTFLCSINIVDYSMILGLSFREGDTDKIQEAPSEMTIGIIDYLRQFDLIKRVESVSKSVGMIAGQSSPTIIESGLYGKRFKDAMHRYFMPVSSITSGKNEDIL